MRLHILAVNSIRKFTTKGTAPMEYLKEAFTAQSAATSCELPRQQADHAIKRGELKAMKSGKRWIILREDLLAWLHKCRDKGEIQAPITQRDREMLAALNRSRRTAAAKAAKRAARKGV